MEREKGGAPCLSACTGHRRAACGGLQSCLRPGSSWRERGEAEEGRGGGDEVDEAWTTQGGSSGSRVKLMK